MLLIMHLGGSRDIRGSGRHCGRNAGIDQRAGIGSRFDSCTTTGCHKAGNGAPAHVLKIDAHAEGGREVAKRGEIGDEPGPIRVVAANAETFARQAHSRFKHRSNQSIGNKIGPTTTNSMS